jgi:transglutaminase-like putative cysteine protease
MPVFRIQHITKYQYERPVKESVNEIRIFPINNNEQEVLQHDLVITGTPDVFVYKDYWDNRTGLFNLLPAHKELVIDSRLVVRTLTPVPFEIDATPGLKDLEPEINDNLKLLELSTPDMISSQEQIDQIITEVHQPGATIASIIQNCGSYIFNQFSYTKGITDIETTVDEILEHRGGVCQDFAHIMLQVMRTLHIPGRYVSGYICPNKNGLRGEGATHAWVEAWIPGQGWTGIDPTNNVWVTDNHVKLAVGRNFDDCSPVKGTFKGASKQSLSVFVSVGYEDGQIFEDTNSIIAAATVTTSAIIEAAQQ